MRARLRLRLALTLGLACALSFVLLPGYAEEKAESAAASTPAASASTSTPAAVPKEVVRVASGEHVVLELQDPVNTHSSKQGDEVEFTTTREIMVGLQEAIPAKSKVRAKLATVKKAGRAGRSGQVGLEFEEVTLPDGTTLPFKADLVRVGFTQVGKDKITVKGEGGSHKQDVVTVASGAGQGALIGVMAGGMKGAAYGSAIGAGIGIIEVLMKKGPELDLPQGTLFEVALSKPVDVPQASVERFAQMSRPVPGASTSMPVATASNNGNFTFPDAPAEGAPADDVPIPEFPEDTTSTSTGATPPAPAGEPTAPSTPTTTTTTTKPAGNGSGTTAPSSEPTTTATNTMPGLPGPLPPPPPPPPDAGTYKMSVDVRLVTVEAFVRDSRGRVLDNLTKDDFELYEDGVKQTIRNFSRDELPLAVALVVDRSGSVAPYMPDLRRAAYDTLTQLKPGDEVALFAFSSDFERLEDLTTDRRRIAERIARIRAGGGTNITDALFAATQYLAMAAPDRRRVVILVSDNQETTRGYTDQGRVIRMALETESVIYSVRTPGEPSSLTMRLPNWLGGPSSVNKITQQTGGEIIDVQSVGSLQAAMAAVVARLKTRYTLGYQSTNKAADGTFRRIEVRLNGKFGAPSQDYTVYARSGYYAPTETVAAQPTR